MAQNWVFNRKLGWYRAGCGCQMRMELIDGLIARKMIKTCKRHQEATVGQR
jgi:hypothetical protein